MSRLSRVRYEAQLEDGYCLPACARMVLAALDVPLSQQAIALRLQTSDAGTPFSRLRRLADANLNVDVQAGGTIEQISTAIAADIPVIAAVDATWLPHAQIESPHAVVVVNLSASQISILDPAAGNEVIDVPLDAWLAAWIEMDCIYAVITR
ncbi:MAG: C39 family peptidase [Caldilinea sp.]|nr:C39 family peptidase [Caldilinea sp.]